MLYRTEQKNTYPCLNFDTKFVSNTIAHVFCAKICQGRAAITSQKIHNNI